LVVGHDASPGLHLHPVTLSAHGVDMVASLPLKCAFDWHCLQCIVNAFGTQEYKNFPNVEFFKTVSDPLRHDEYEADNKIELPYPSSHFDRYLAEQRRRQMARERREEMAKWYSGISSDI
jgi:hypothetical protein